MKTPVAKKLPLIMGVPEDHVLTQGQFLLKFQDRHRYPGKSRPFCFILGAGASIQSGIPGAKALIDEWLPDLHRASGSSDTLKKWTPLSHDRIKGYSYDRRAEFYSQLYALRFRDCEDDGALFLQDKMKDAQPSYGYAVLAQLLGGPHRVVLTTNFDSLAPDAIFQFGGEAPFVCGHESLASYIPAHNGRPVIIKLHRDLLTGAINDPDGTSHLHNAWHQPVRDILQRFTPVFIGYGGNDGSLMDFLEALPDGIPDKIYWCQYKKDPPIKRVADFLSKEHRYLVPIDGFDQLMSALHSFLGLPDLLKALEDINQRRLAHLRTSQASLTTAATQDVADTTAAQGPDSPDALAAHYQLATALFDQGRYREAEAEHRFVLEARRRVLGAEHPETLHSWHQWGRCLGNLRKNVEAEAEYRQLSAISVRILGPEHPDTLTTRNNLALALSRLGKREEADKLLWEVLRIRERILGPEHTDTLWSRNNWAGVLQAQEKYAEAETEHRAVLTVRERTLGIEHPDTLVSRSNVAITLFTQGKNAEAEAEHRIALAGRERVLGPDHPATLASRNNIVLALRAQGKIADAEAEHRAVLSVMERVLGPENPDTLSSRNNLANALHAQRKFAEAEADYRTVLTVRERVLGPDDAEVFRSHYNLALCLESQGDEKAAQKNHKEARRLLVDSLGHAQAAQRGGERVLGVEHPQLVNYNNEVRDLQSKLSGLPPEE